MNFTTIPEMLLQCCEKYKGSGKPALKYKKNKEYVSITHDELLQKVEHFAIGLLNLGVRSNDRIGIVSENRMEWAIVDLAIVSIGAIDVPIFPTLSAAQEEFIFADCEASAIIVSNKFQLNKVLEFKDNLPCLRQVIVMNDDFETHDMAVRSMERVISRATELKSDAECHEIFLENAYKVKPDDLLTIIYTSGTTGNPKGVMLTHSNVVTNIKGAIEAADFRESDVLLSYLPWCHSYERTGGYYSGMAVGATIGLAESIDTVGANLLEIKPTLMTTVPRLLELFRRKILTSMEKEPFLKKKMFNWALENGKKYIKAKKNGDIPKLLKAEYNLADKLVFTKIREKIGGNKVKFVSGGAALSPDISEFFTAAGFTIIEGYGLTETSPVVTLTRLENLEIGTVGQPISGVEIKIAPDGEILVRGPNVMKGYWNDKFSTNEAIDDEGWLYTGDVGKITERGNLKITDRKKSLFVSSGGKNIAPQPIENLLLESPYVEQCVLIGDRREYCTALITPNFRELEKLAASLNISYKMPTELISNREIIMAIKHDLDRLQHNLAKYERVRKFSLLSEPFSVENGELTPKLNVKRHVVERHYSDLIDQMYGFNEL